MRKLTILAAVVTSFTVGRAYADESVMFRPPPPELRSQAQIDGGLSVIGVGYETPIAAHVAVQFEAFLFGTYFLPWFDAGDEVKGLGGGARVTWFARTSGYGLYAAPYVRVIGVTDDGLVGSTPAVTAGAFIGWAFKLSAKLDLRLGVGGQYIHFEGDDGVPKASTPFFAIDGVLGYRL